MKRADFGSGFYFEKRFNSRSKDESQQTEREWCVRKGTRTCPGGGVSALGVGVHGTECTKDFDARCSVTLVGNMFLIYSAI